MWPFSTIRNLRLELQQAERGNQTLRGIINRQEAQIESFKRGAKLDEQVIREAQTAIQSGKLALEASETVRKHLAAERDEAVLRARNVADLRMQDARTIGTLRDNLRGALVRDPKTGRMTKWADPNATPDNGWHNGRYEWTTVSASMGEPKS